MKEKKQEVKEVGLGQLEVQYHPRKEFGEIEKLQGSIKRDGLQEPLLVYEAGEGRFAIIDGCRRFKAVQGLGWKVVPCLIKKDIKPAEAAHLSYVRNTEREGFNPIEIACHMKAMRDTFGFSLRDLELKGYGTPPSIASKIKLLELPEKVQSQIRKGELTIAHGLSLLKMSNPEEMERMAKRVVDFEMSAKRADLADRHLPGQGQEERGQSGGAGSGNRYPRCLHQGCPGYERTSEQISAPGGHEPAIFRWHGI